MFGVSLSLGLFLFLIKGFQWSGCSDNLSYGVAFSQTFVDEPERAKGLSAGRPLMNIHNNESGRKVAQFPPFSKILTVCHPDAHSSCTPHPPPRPSFTTCRSSASVMASLDRASWGPAGRWCLRSGVLALCSRNALTAPQRYVSAAPFRKTLKIPLVPSPVTALLPLGPLDSYRVQNSPAAPWPPGETPRCQRSPLPCTLSWFLPSRSRERDPGDCR